MGGPQGANRLEVVTLYAAQAPDQQMVVFKAAPPNSRKVSVLPFMSSKITFGSLNLSICETVAEPNRVGTPKGLEQVLVIKHICTSCDVG